ncbi:E3 ubiquitin-protein ligase RNF180-like [Ornithodoros turicata]
MQCDRNEVNTAKFRCKKCRATVFTSADVVSAHGKPWTGHVNFCCPLNKASTVWYLRETEIVDWMEDQVHNGKWTKGRLYCPACSARLGSYDFVAGSKCGCSQFVLPAIHIAKCRVDCDETMETEKILKSIVRPPATEQSSEEDLEPCADTT